MTLFDVGVACSILHGLVLLFGYLSFTSIHASIHLIASTPIRTFFIFAHTFIPTLTVCGSIACWMSVVHRSQFLAVLFLCIPVAGVVILGMIYMCSNLEEHGPTNKEILHGRSEDYYKSQGLSHVDFANDLIARTYEYAAAHPDFEMEHSPYLRERLARMSPRARPPSAERQ